jgi:hypothetical protein
MQGEGIKFRQLSLSRPIGGVTRDPIECEVMAMTRELSPSSDFLIATKAL